MVFDIKPEALLLDSFPSRLVEDVLIFPPRVQNHLSTTHFGDSVDAGLGAEAKEVAEKIESWIDAKKSLTKVGDDGKCWHSLS